MNLSQDILQQFEDLAKRPEGTFEFTYATKFNLFDSAVKGWIIFELVAGKHYFRLERNDNAEVVYYYSSPGTGTRVASVDLKKMKRSDKVFFAFTWSPEEINLYVGPQIEGGALVGAKGEISQKKFQVGEDGKVIQIGDIGIEVMGTRMNIGGKQIIKPTAIDTWKGTRKAIEILSTGESKEGFIFDTVKANLSIVVMVTGFEAYSKARFQEFEGEGIIPNFKKINEKLRLTKETILNPHTNYFQDIGDSCAKIYLNGVDIKFGDLLSDNELGRLKLLFKFRHRIIHVSPLLTQVNEFQVPQQAPVLSLNIINESLELFDKFINNLHEATLKLRSKN